MSNPFELDTSIRSGREVDSSTEIRKPILRSRKKTISEDTDQKLDNLAIELGIATDDEVKASNHIKSQANDRRAGGSVQTNFRLPVELNYKLQEMADDTGLKKTTIVVKALQAYLNSDTEK